MGLYSRKNVLIIYNMMNDATFNILDTLYTFQKTLKNFNLIDRKK